MNTQLLNPLTKLATAITLIGLLLSPLRAQTDTTKWKTDGLEIQYSVNDGDYETFFAKGMAYSPAPIGDGGADEAPFNDFFYRHPDLPDSVKQYQAIWERDIGDSNNPGLLREMGVNSIRLYSMLKHMFVNFNVYDGEGNPVPIWPFVDQLDWSLDKPPIDQWYVHYGHDAFLDMCWNNGEDPIYVWIGVPFDDIFFGYAPDSVAKELKAQQFDFFKKTTEWLAKSYGNHPAVLGFVLGNEHDGEAAPDISLRGDGIIQTRFGPLDFSDPEKLPVLPTGGWPPEVVLSTRGGHLERQGDTDVYDGIPIGGTTWRKTYWDKLNELHDIVKQHAPNKLTTTSLHDDPNILIHWMGEVDEVANTTTVLEQTPREYSKLDVWSFNAYNIPGLTGGAFPRYKAQVIDYAKSANKPEIVRPLLLTELGVPASTRDGYSGMNPQDFVNSPLIELPNNAQAAADLILDMWRSVSDNKTSSQSGANPVSSGAYIFEFSDEWWKHGNKTAHDGGGAGSGFFPGGFWDEEWFGLFSVSPSPDRGNRGGENKPLNERPVINESTGDLNGGPDILTPRAIVALLTNEFKARNPLSASAGSVPGGGSGGGGSAVIQTSPWYGDFFDLEYPWVYHFGQGWQFVVGESANALFVWDPDLGWTFTSDEVYPSMYLFASNQWVYYDETTNTYFTALVPLEPEPEN